MLRSSRKRTRLRTCDSLHSSNASTKRTSGFGQTSISESRKSCSSGSRHAHSVCFCRLLRNRGMNRSYVEDSLRISWYTNERSIPIGVCSKLSPRALKKCAATIAFSNSFPSQYCKVCFISVDFPVPGFPLIQSTPLWLESSVRWHHCWNCSVLKSQLHVVGWAEDISIFRASMFW